MPSIPSVCGGAPTKPPTAPAPPAWETLLDIDALAKTEGVDWVWGGATLIPGTHDRALLKLSRGGGDATILREFDLPTLSFVADGFTLPEAKGGADWLDRDTLILSSALGEGMATPLRLFPHGSALDARPGPARGHHPVRDRAREYGSLGRGRPRRALRARGVHGAHTGFFDGILHIGDRTGPTHRIDAPTDAEISLHGDHLVIRTRSEWSIGGALHVPDTVLAIGLPAFLDGDRGFTVLWTPSDRRALQNVSWAGPRLIVDALDDLRPSYNVFEPGEGGWNRLSLPGLPEIGSVSVWPFDSEQSESDGSLLALVQDPLTPPTLLSIPGDLSAPTILRTTPSAFDTKGLTVTRHEAISVDGERIPYVQVGPAGASGDAPVHLSAYGGFQISLLPTYQAVLGKLWLEKGGVGVVANIRGGGEFGTRWHQAGRREGKALAHDDFAAVAADLVARGVTKPQRIAAQGGSNGGLLIANMLTRYPERFGALFCTIPLIDMRRYSKLLAGASWIAEYGDPDVEADWSFLGAISAYHTAEAGKPYPPILIATTRRDDPRPSGACPQDGGEATPSRVRPGFLRAGGRRSRLRQGQFRDRRFPGPRNGLPSAVDRLGSGGQLKRLRRRAGASRRG